MKKSIRLLTVLFLFSLGVIAQEADGMPESPVAEVYLAKDDGTGKPGEPATAFVLTDIPIHCVVQLSFGQPATVRMNLVAANVPGVKPETQVVSTTYTTKDLQNRVNFSGRPQGKWVPGEYRADIFVGDKLVRSITFPIAAGTTPNARVPASIESSTKKPRRTRTNLAVPVRQLKP